MMRVIRLPGVGRRTRRGVAVAGAGALLAAPLLLVGGGASGAAAPKPTTTVTQTVTVTKTVTAPPQTVTTTVTAPPQTVTQTQTVTVTAPPATTTTVPTATTTTSTPTSTATVPAGMRLTPVDGGANWYSQFANAPNYSNAVFPLAVWLESVQSQGDVDLDKAAGLNTYLEVTDNSNEPLLSTSGMNIITDQHDAIGVKKNGHLLWDEADMFFGPGNGPWNGDVHNPACTTSTDCGYTVMAGIKASKPVDGKVRFANYGKGVLFWESETEAAPFINDFQDFVETDAYWYTDQDICVASQGGIFLGFPNGDWKDLTQAQCRRASNYGAQVDKVRRLAGYSKPVWQAVELGHPGTNGGQVTIPQIKAATWATLIHGARGIVYFNHSFAGACPTQHILRDPCYTDVRAAVTALNAQITRLAAVLNAPTVDGATTVSGPVDVLTKFSGGQFYLFAGAHTAEGGAGTISVPCVGNATVTVLDEGRTLPVTNGAFTDAFANGEAYHLYRVDGGSNCGLG